jgi:hypothetical protein
MLPAWVSRRLFGKLFRPGNRPRPGRCRPAVEPLEERALLSGGLPDPPAAVAPVTATTTADDPGPKHGPDGPLDSQNGYPLPPNSPPPLDGSGGVQPNPVPVLPGPTPPTGTDSTTFNPTSSPPLSTGADSTTVNPPSAPAGGSVTTTVNPPTNPGQVPPPVSATTPGGSASVTVNPPVSPAPVSPAPVVAGTPADPGAVSTLDPSLALVFAAPWHTRPAARTHHARHHARAHHPHHHARPRA